MVHFGVGLESGTYRLACMGPAKAQAAQGRDSGWIDAAARDEHVEGFSHSGWSDEMLQLQRYFGALLRNAAILEGVSKLRLLSDA
jgi:hypothetical protein